MLYFLHHIMSGLYIFFFFNWRLITLQHCGCLCHTFTWIRHACTCVPHPEPPSHLSPHPVPQGHPRAPALSTLSHALNLDWRSTSHFNAILPNHPTLALSHRVQKSVLYICVSLAVSHIGSSLPSLWIPYICVNVLVFFFLTFTLYNRLQFHPPH